MRNVGATEAVVLAAILGAMSFLLYYVHFALIIFPSYLTYDPGDLPALVAGLAAGPLVGIAVEVVKNILYLLIGAGTPVGVAANLVAGVVYLVVAVPLAKSLGKRSALAGDGTGPASGARLAVALAAASVVTAVVMTVTNAYIWLPAYGIPRATARALLWPAILPFNLVKFAITSVLGYVLVVALRPALAGRFGGRNARVHKEDVQ